jgi:hypothetical protein
MLLSSFPRLSITTTAAAARRASPFLALAMCRRQYLGGRAAQGVPLAVARMVRRRAQLTL